MASPQRGSGFGGIIGRLVWQSIAANAFSCVFLG
jgi:hypothetical protein